MIRRIRATGSLATDPSHLTDPEALRTADNVMLHRPGLIQPRFGLGDTTGIAARSPTDRPIAIVAFDGDVIIQSLVTSTYVIYRGSDTTQISVDAAPPDTAIRGVSSFASARGSLYLTTDDGPKKLVAVTDSALDLAGVATDYVEVITYKQTDLADAGADIDRYALVEDGAVAYRYCWVREDANGYIRRSSPSARFVVYDDDGAASGPYMLEWDRLYLPDGIIAGDKLEIYRTENVTPATGTPSTEYYLAITYTVTSTNVSAGYIEKETIYDDTPDSLLGATLYTSPSQGGILQSNEVPPLANVIAHWGDVMWYGNTTSRRALDIEIVSLGDVEDANDPYGAHARTGLYLDLITGTFTNGAATVTALVPNAHTHPHGLKVGMYVNDATNGPSVAGTKIPALTKIATITTTVTIVNASLNAGDTIRIFGHLWTWTAGAAGTDEIQKGASSDLSAAALATAINGFDFDEPVTIVATANAAVVTVTESSGLCACAIPSSVGMVTAYALTMDKNATATGSILFTAGDYVTINGVEFFCEFTTSFITGSTYGVGGVVDPQYRLFTPDVDSSGGTPQDFNARLSNTATNLARAINAYTVVTSNSFGVIAYNDVENTRGESVGNGALTLLRTTPGGAAFSMSCTVRPLAFRPQMSTAVTTADTRARNRLYWSKLDEPEAVPVLNFTDIGRRDADILALVPLDRALLVFKEDGIYSVTGTAPNAWIVDEIDLDMRLLAPQAVCALNGIAYAWTDRGIVAVTEAGARVLSQPIGDQLRELQRLLPLDDANTKRAFWAVAHKRHGLVIFGLGDAAADTITANWYVFHTGTGRWARWPIASRCAAYDPAEDRMLHSPGIDAWSVLYEREDEDAAASYRDASLSGLAGTVSSLQVTIATSAFGGFTPAAGDVLVDGSSVKARVESVSTNGANKLLTISTALTGVSFTWHQGYASTLVWSPQALPGQGCRWTEGHIHMMTSDSAYVSTFPIQVGGLAEHSTGFSPLTVTYTPIDAEGSPKYGVTRYGQPRDIVRAATMSPVIIITTAGALWTLAELDLEFRPQSQRVAR